MTRTAVTDVSSIPDPAQLWEFDLFLPSIPGSSNTSQLTFRCMTTALPGTQIDQVMVPLHGVELAFMGRRIYTHTFNSTFLEAIDWQTRGQLITWMEAGRSWVTNTGSQSATYKVQGQLVVYDDTPAVANTITIMGMWPHQINDVELDGGQSQHVTQNITWSYDYTIDS